MLPPLAVAMGTGLFYLSPHSQALRTFLGIHPLATPVGPGRHTSGSGTLDKGTLSYRNLDPIWWRNTVGIALFTVLKDATVLWHRYLRLEEKRSREIVSKPFVNVDLEELDLATE
ncbi:hypothetical protein FRB99_000064 [Tulasnella sp. 403]|nr:hypothetical protein FRB99_000064 [Tulasnella sp. 403]